MSHDPSEILAIMNAINSYAAFYFCGKHETFVQDSLMSRKSKRTAYIRNRNLL